MFLTPRWILSHVFVLALIVAFVIAGFWQVDRLGQRRDENALIRSRMGESVSFDVAEGSEPDDLEYLRVQVEGSFDPDSSILIANRSDEGTPGFWMWTNFVTSSDGDLLVNRGFVERSVILGLDGSARLADAEPTDGVVLIEGLLRRGIDGGRIADAGDQLSRPDAAFAVELLSLDPALDPEIYLELTAQEPPRASSVPRPVPAPDLGEGSHGSYAFQWFTFAVMGAIGYVALLLRIRRGDQERGDVPHDLEPSAGAPHAAV